MKFGTQTEAGGGKRGGHPGIIKKRGRAQLRKNGTWYAALTALLLAVIVVINLIAAAVPAKFTVFDMTDTKLYSTGEVTREVLEGLDRDVTLYYITQTGQADEIVQKLLDNYAAESPHVKVVGVDAVADPAFASKYTDEQVSLNSVIAVCGDKSKLVRYQDMYGYTGYYSQSPDYFDGEGLLTSAISYVSGGAQAKVYYTVGHNEFALGGEMTDALDKANIETEGLNLLSTEVPGDCTALIAFAPLQDFTEEEAGKVIHYLEQGGHVMLVSAPGLWTGSETPVYDGIAASFGVERTGGVVLEGDADRYTQAPYLIVPEISQTAEAVSGLANQNILLSMGEALELPDEEEADEVCTVTPLLSSSDSAYLKTSLEGSLEKEKGDESGTFVLGAAVEQTFSQDSKGSPDVELTDSRAELPEEEAAKDAARLLVFTTPCLFSSDALSTLLWQPSDLPAGNDALFAAAMKYLTDQEAVVSVPAKSMAVPQTTVAAGAVMLFGNLFMIILPAAVLVLGFTVWFRRRRR